MTNKQKKCKLYSYYRYSSNKKYLLQNIKATDFLCHIRKRKKVEEKIEISILLSLYGNLLTPTQKKYMEQYYNKDLSLSEIGENEQITRQAVRTILVKSKKKLQEYEENLQYRKKEKEIKKLTQKLEETKLNQVQQQILEQINNLLEC